MADHDRIASRIKNILESTDLSELPPTIVSEIEKEIRSGAKDLDLKWSNALELVQHAYDLAGVERPTPTMQAAWSQYEKFISYAVSQLAKFRGSKGTWRSYYAKN